LLFITFLSVLTAKQTLFLLNTVFTIKLTLFRVIHLGCKVANKHRPFLLSIDDLHAKASLRRHDQYKTIFITPDRTKLECEKNKKAVEELKKRHANGEKGLTVCNGYVVARQPQINTNIVLTSQNSAERSAEFFLMTL